ncbi:hypothetical protein SRHO_G00321560 [Serrasalmus rhombeus]
MPRNLTNNPSMPPVTQSHRCGTADPLDEGLAEPALGPWRVILTENGINDGICPSAIAPPEGIKNNRQQEGQAVLG